jgi:hypothetical protein
MKTSDTLNKTRFNKKHLQKTINALHSDDSFTPAEKATLLEIYEVRLKKYDAIIAREIEVIDIYEI